MGWFAMEVDRQEQQIASLRDELEATRRALEQQRREQARQLDLAAQIHHSLLPTRVKDSRLDVAVEYLPVDAVGGDYCQVRFASPDVAYFTMSDVAGHGVGPALLAARVSSEVRRLIHERARPREISRTLNAFMLEHFAGSGRFVTFVAARIDLTTGELVWSSAGHPSPLLSRYDGTCQRLEVHAPPVGVAGVSDEVWPDEDESSTFLSPGDRLVLYTDGVIESRNAQHQQFGLAHIEDTIRSLAADSDAFELAAALLDEVHSHRRGGPEADDTTLIVATLKGLRSLSAPKTGR